MKKISDAAQTFILCALIGLICAFSGSAKEGAAEGIKLCESVIIPSLLPILIICTLIINSRLSKVFELLFGRLFEKLFRLPRCCAGAVIFGLTGGYPTGTILTYNLHKTGLIDGNAARRIMRFNFCGGFAFIITAVGTVTYGSTKTGIILFLANLLSSVIICLFSAIGEKRPEKTGAFSEYPEVYDALPKAVEGTVKALAVMSAYVVLFSCICRIIKLPSGLMPLIEITNGICGAEANLSLPYCAFFLAFGGLCIHLQLFGFLREMKIKYAEFLTYRMACALLSFGLTRLYVYFFPQIQEVFSNVSKPVHEFSSGGLTLSLIMIIGCAVIVFDIENRKLKLI